MAKMTKNQKNAVAMVEAARKMGAVARATNAELRQAIYDLSNMGNHDGVNVLIAEEARRAGAMAALRHSLSNPAG